MCLRAQENTTWQNYGTHLLNAEFPNIPFQVLHPRYDFMNRVSNRITVPNVTGDKFVHQR